MNKKLEEIRDWIEEELSSFSELIEFKIGKASDCEERFKTYYQPKGYQSYIELATGSPLSVSDGERNLLDYFLDHPKWKDKCANERSGSAGDPNASHLYLTVKCKMKSIDDLYDELFQEEWEPKKLD